MKITVIRSKRIAVIENWIWDGDMKILAIDQARNGAWAIFDYGEKRLEKYDTFSFGSRNYSYAQAILAIESLVWNVILENNVDAVFIEDIQLRKNVHGFKRLAQLQGVLVNLFEKNKYLYDYVAPSQWQNYCGARGRNNQEIKDNIRRLEEGGKKHSKALSIEMVKELYGIETENDNLADAILQGHYVVNCLRITEGADGVMKIERMKSGGKKS